MEYHHPIMIMLYGHGGRSRRIRRIIIDMNWLTSADTVEEEFFSHLAYYVVAFCLKITDGQPQSARNTVLQRVIWSVTTWIIGCHPYQSFNIQHLYPQNRNLFSFFPAHKFYFNLPIVISSGISIHFYTRFTRKYTFIQFHTSISTVINYMISSGLYSNQNVNNVGSTYLQ